jgi:ABC-2 type transport system permease protein
LALAAIFCVWISGRIYRIGILMYGKKGSFKEIWKWVRSKD